jgi:hypothetical protein
MSNPSDVLNDDSWKTAREMFLKFGNFSNIFTQSIRTIVKYRLSDDKNDPVCLFVLQRMLSSPTVRAKYHFAVLTAKQKSYDPDESISISELITEFSPLEHCSILALIFAYSVCKVKTNSSHIHDLDKLIQELGEAGMILGHHCSDVTILNGLLIGTCRYLTFSVLSCAKPNEFTKYKALLKKI